MKNFTLLALLLIMSLGYGQVTNEGRPASWRIKGIEKPQAIIMPSFNLDSIQAEDRVRDLDQNKPWRFGYEFLTDNNLQNSGVWHTMPNGDRVWRIRYVSHGAKTLNFLFSDFYMPKGAKVYLYNNDRSDLLGAYDEKQNNESRVLGTWLVSGDDIWIEYFEPAAVAGQGKLEIFKVVHGYRTVTLINPDSNINNSQDCHFDAECFLEGINNIKDISKKSTGLIIVNNSNFCSGTLINNVNNDGTPYFLTANHCYSDPTEWAFLFNWVSPNPVCGGEQQSANNAPNYYLTASGAQLKARKEEPDFMLVEMTSDIPVDWDVVWSGWDRSEVPPPFTYGLHHPSGDIMKLSYDADPPIAEDIEDNGMGYIWVQESIEVGALEPGSSGSGMFDNTGRLIGQAWFIAGNVCNGINTGGLLVGYGRLGVSWDMGETPDTRLKDWLDPDNTGVMTTGWYPSQEFHTLDAKAIFYEHGYNPCGNQVAPVLRLINNGTQNLTSAQISYSFNGADPVIIDWTGNIAENESALIDLPQNATVAGENTLEITVLNPNNGTDEDTSNNSIYESFVTPGSIETSNVVFTITTDIYGEEVSWSLKDTNGNVLYSVAPNSYGDSTTYSQTFMLEEGCYTFTIKDVYGDGICCSQGEGSYSLTTTSGEVIVQGGNYGAQETTTFKMADNLGIADMKEENLTIYPNPSSGLFTIASSQNIDGTAYTIYNMLGQTVKSGSFASGTNTVDLTEVPQGIYLLQASGNGREQTYKLIKE
ncbi:T9SS type A sorting domain-containing protein [Flavobacterium alkalisoli]|uniref:T9SS type A sorting domain-containing protein n=1 Tax=Flavobacterium alkalisoli TaxID=2602769 RepID=A0A5B9FV51_9FLAO|nr:T9SS type A sorting domain-containing protein [Flavobacterium alkalisoli]QEE50870.1 T9SS type A sorting domain-containing protein [Flavobacterium alkalisoli]